MRGKLILLILAVLILASTVKAQVSLDIYGGMTVLPCSGGPTGYFYLEKRGGRWFWCTPLGNSFWELATYVNSTSFIQRTPIDVISVKYGGNKTNWAINNNQRSLSWNFNTIGEYAVTYALPVNTNGFHNNANPVKLPFIPIINGVVSLTLYYNQYGLVDPLKNLIIGVPSTIQVYRGGRMADMFLPAFSAPTTGYKAVINYQNTLSYTDGFGSTPWILGITTDDTDYLFGLKNRGDAPISQHPNIGFITAVVQFNYTGLGGRTWTDPKLYTKYAWACGIPGVDFGYGIGKSYLENKYVTIAALNASWGSTYTAFCDDGGYGVGTGVLDEDGRHTAWMGSGQFVAYNLTGTNVNTAADMNQFLYDYAYHYAHTAVTSIRSVDTHHVIYTPPISAGGYETRTQVLQAFKDAGMQIVTMSFPPNGDFSGAKATYDLIGLPITFWYGIKANPDSPLNGYIGDTSINGYTTQADRGIHYGLDLNTFLNLQATGGDYYQLGIDFWEWTDGNFYEKTNWGMVTDRDNQYDNYHNTTTPRPDGDRGQYTSIPEDANYGNVVNDVAAANIGILRTLISAGSNLTINGPVTCPNGNQGSPYPGCFPQATGGILPYTWDISAGTLCHGLSINSATGAVTGTPTTVESCDFTIRVTDSTPVTPETASKEYLPKILFPVLTITTGTLPTGSQGVPYSASQTFTGGNGTNTWSLTSGGLPLGLTLNTSTGKITGTPSATGNYPFTIKATDTESPPQVATKDETIIISGASGLRITTTSLPIGNQNSLYTATMTATGGTAPYTWSAPLGFALCPTGINSIQPITGKITGTPTTTGACNLAIKVTDRFGAIAFTGSLLQLLVQAPVLTINTPVCPAGAVGTLYTCVPATTGGSGPISWAVISGTLPPGLSMNGSLGYIQGIPVTRGSYTFTLSATDSETPPQVATASVTIVISSNVIMSEGNKLSEGNKAK